MLTGTPLDLTSFGVLFQAIGIIYWIAFFGLLYLAIKKPRTRTHKAVWALVVLVVFLGGPFHNGWNNYQAQQRYQAAKAHFDERCKEAGEKITKRVTGIDGIRWMKPRSSAINLSNQYLLDDPYGWDCGGDGCIMDLLKVTSNMQLDPLKTLDNYVGFESVEVFDQDQDIVYRYQLTIERPRDNNPLASETYIRSKLTKASIPKPVARYGVDWEDISTTEDRKNWVAGGKLKIIDLEDNVVIAERIGFMFDRGLGDTSGGRSPWSFAAYNACPPFPRAAGGGPFHGYKTRDFVLKVLTPR
jgi:hypothetical protein